MEVLSINDLRKKSIGGTDIAAIVGLNPYKTAVDVYNEKRGLSEDIEDNQYLKAGRMLEDAIAQWFEQDTGIKISKPEQELNYHYKHKFLHANPDRYLTDNQGNKGILECKLTSKDVKDRDHFKSEFPHYYLQLQWYLGITGRSEGYMAVLSTSFGYNFQYFHFDFNESLFKKLVDKALKFWENTRLGIAPEVQNSDDYMKLNQLLDGDYAVASEQDYKDLEKLQSLKQEIKELKEQEDNLSEIIKLRIGANEGMIYDDKIVATFKAHNQKRIDSKKIKADKPDLFNEYSKNVKVRTLRLK